MLLAARPGPFGRFANIEASDRQPADDVGHFERLSQHWPLMDSRLG
jgi:hypothetical protein